MSPVLRHATFFAPHGEYVVEEFDAWVAEGKPGPVFVAIFDPSARRALVERLRDAGARFASTVPADNWIAPSATFGEGTIVCAPAVVMVSSRLGRFVIVLPQTSIGHDVVLGDYVSIGERACVSGHVVIGAGTIVGNGVLFGNGSAARPLTIGTNAYIADNSVVTKNVPDGATVSGNPAKRARV